jgi:hypothetical protein
LASKKNDKKRMTTSFVEFVFDGRRVSIYLKIIRGNTTSEKRKEYGESEIIEKNGPDRIRCPRRNGSKV